jgi:transcriptional regulator with XRE-family HTH domain
MAVSRAKMVLELKATIEADGRSLNQLAKASGMSTSQLSRFMRGERDIGFGPVAKLCDVLGIKFVLPADAPAKGAKPARKPKGTK